MGNATAYANKKWEAWAYSDNKTVFNNHETHTICKTSGVFRGGGLCEAPFGRTAVIFVIILGLF